VVDLLKLDLDIDPRHSEDTLRRLEVGEFGYRSVHLVARFKSFRLSAGDEQLLRNQRFEVQVRSLLQHAWGEIEHEVVYKADCAFPKGVKRRFARVAGALELLDREFLGLRQEYATLVDGYLQRYRDGEKLGGAFDPPRLIAWLEHARPDGYGWRNAAANREPFPAHIEANCLYALRDVGLASPKSLQSAFRDRKFRRKCARFALAEGIPEQQVSHLALVVLAVATRNARILDPLFPQKYLESFRRLKLI